MVLWILGLEKTNQLLKPATLKFTFNVFGVPFALGQWKALL